MSVTQLGTELFLGVIGIKILDLKMFPSCSLT